MSLSDRQSDAFDNPAKMACREGNLRVLREAAFLLWHDGDRSRLRCDWCELMGATGLLTLDLLERQGVLAPGGFVGIDLDPARIDGFRQGRPDLKWVAGNLGRALGPLGTVYRSGCGVEDCRESGLSLTFQTSELSRVLVGVLASPFL